MKKEKIQINYDVLRTGDRVICGGVSPFAMITRIVTGDVSKAFDYDVAVHTGLIIDVYGQKLIAEMQPKGLEINSLENYTTIGSRRFVIDIVRSIVFNIKANRTKLEKNITYLRRKTIEYDYKGLLEFVFNKVRDNRNKNYCSEFDYMVTKELGCIYPDTFRDKVSPKDLQELTSWKSVSGWKI